MPSQCLPPPHYSHNELRLVDIHLLTDSSGNVTKTLSDMSVARALTGPYKRYENDIAPGGFVENYRLVAAIEDGIEASYKMAS